VKERVISTRPTSTYKELKTRVAYVKAFDARLTEAAACALGDNPTIASQQVGALFSAQERVHAAWAGADLNMPIEEAVALLLILGALAEADKDSGRPEHRRTRAALAAHAKDVLLAGREPSSPDIFERFTALYTALLRDGGDN
jgi:hypothetical protein